MPLFEEKVVSPFSIRFTQDHIRTTFRDGRVVESTIQEIGSVPGFGGYDLVLNAPFPPIEILRWSVPRQDADLAAEASCPVGVRPREHWFTLDNRRLYCLQRAAVALWPARVASVVAILYADPGTVRKKFDSTNFGWSVSIAHSYEELPVARWDWRERVLPLEVGAVNELHGVLEAVLADDRKRTASALLDAERLHGGARPADAARRSSTPSTPEGSDLSDGDGARQVHPKPRRRQQSMPTESFDMPATTLASVPPPDGYDSVVANAVREIKQQITARGSCGRVVIPDWDDRYGAKLGPLRRFVESRPDKFTLTPAGDGSGDFTVAKARRPRGVAAQGGAGDVEVAAPPGDSLTACALAEIEEQLNVPKHDGRVSIPHWRTRYEPTLGSIKSFVKRWPDRFTVFAGEGRHFRVVRKGDGLAMSAIREIEEQLDQPDADGRLDFPHWHHRYAAELGSLREFLGECEERFTIVSMADDPEIRVMKTRDALARRAISEIEEQLSEPDHDGRLRLPHWNDVYGASLGNLRAFLESRPDKFNVSVSEDRRYTVSKCSDDIAERALREIEEQLSDTKQDGRSSRVPRWNERYREALGPLRTFLERWPERFRIARTSGEGGKFIVARTSDVLEVRALHLVDVALGPVAEGVVEVPGWGAYEARFGSLRAFLSRWPGSFRIVSRDGPVVVRRVVDEVRLRAIAEIDERLSQVGVGPLEVRDWESRYAPSLGRFRAFLEDLPGRYTVIPGRSGAFSLARVPPEVVGSAIREVERQFAEADYDGFVHVPEWTERYCPFLGTLRQFLNSLPERFRITYIGSTMYTYPAVPNGTAPGSASTDGVRPP